LIERLQTDDGRIQLAPTIFVEDIKRLNNTFFNEKNVDNQGFTFEMIGRRVLRTHNTWTHNSHRLVKGRNECTLLLHPKDAENIGLKSGEMAKVTSSTGQIEIEVEVSDEIMQGVVSMPQGWGKRDKTSMRTAANRGGVSINDLTDSSRVDVLTGNAAFNGVRVKINKK
jgi:anaerobic selenocysteine-containing dehydrogenase